MFRAPLAPKWVVPPCSPPCGGGGHEEGGLRPDTYAPSPPFRESVPREWSVSVNLGYAYGTLPPFAPHQGPVPRQSAQYDASHIIWGGALSLYGGFADSKADGAPTPGHTPLHAYHLPGSSTTIQPGGWIRMSMGSLTSAANTSTSTGCRRCPSRCPGHICNNTLWITWLSTCGGTTRGRHEQSQQMLSVLTTVS